MTRAETVEALAKVLRGLFYITEAEAHDYAATTILDAIDAGHVPGLVLVQDYSAPECDSHKEVQHRDGKPPWCNNCGWRHAKPATPAVQVKVFD